MRRRIIVWLCSLVFISLLASGCNGARETDEVGYILLIGLDRGEEGTINVTYQVAVPRSLGASDGGNGTDSGHATSMITLTAPTLAEARNLLNTFMARSPNLSHNKAFIIGEDLARQGVGDAIAPLMRYREYRGSMYILIVQQGTAHEFIKEMKPKLELLPSKYVETMMLTYNETSYYAQAHLHYFYGRMKSNAAAPIAPLVAINPSNQTSQSSHAKSDGEKSEPYTAGNIPTIEVGTPSPQSAVQSNFAGTAVFLKDKMVATLDSKETQLMSILRGQFDRGYLVISDPNLPDKSINLNMRLGKKPKINAQLTDGQPTFVVDILLEGETTSIASGINYERDVYHQQLEQHISQLVRQEIMMMLHKTQSLHCDVVGFGYHVRPLYKSYQEWREIDWSELYSQATIQVTVKTRLRRAGLMTQTAPIQ